MEGFLSLSFLSLSLTPFLSLAPSLTILCLVFVISPPAIIYILNITKFWGANYFQSDLLASKMSTYWGCGQKTCIAVRMAELGFSISAVYSYIGKYTEDFTDFT